MSAVKANGHIIVYGNRKCDHYDGKRYSKQAGITADLSESNEDGLPVVHFWPVNSKGNAGRCYLEMPVECIEAMIDRLLAIKPQ